MAPPPPPPALMDELVEECLLRLPPDDPVNFVRSAVVSKGWGRIITDRGFSRRFRDLHGRSLMLGFLHVHTTYGCFFTPTSSFRPRNVNHDLRLGGRHAVDVRHGRILLSRSPSVKGPMHTRRRSDLAVWDPVSGDQLDLPELPPPPHPSWFCFTSKAAVLCASGSTCDHLDCHRGHFLVVLMDATYHQVDVYVYSSQAGAWSHLTSAAYDHSPMYLLSRQPFAVAGNALYCIVNRLTTTNKILKYDMGAHEVSWVDLPHDWSNQTCQILLTTTEHGGLGIVRVENKSRVHLWSREAGPSGVLEWVPTGAIELETVLPANSGSISTISFVHGLGALFISTNAGSFAVDLVSNRVRKVCGNSSVIYFVP